MTSAAHLAQVHLAHERRIRQLEELTQKIAAWATNYGMEANDAAPMEGHDEVALTQMLERYGPEAVHCAINKWVAL